MIILETTKSRHDLGEKKTKKKKTPRFFKIFFWKRSPIFGFRVDFTGDVNPCLVQKKPPEMSLRLKKDR